MGPRGPACSRRVMVGAGTSPPPMDLPRRGVAPEGVDVAALGAGGTGPVVVGGLSWVRVNLGGPFGVDVVAGQIRLSVGGRRSLLVGGVVGLSAWWVRTTHVLVLFVHGALGPGGVGLWAVVVVAGALVAVMVVAGLLMVMVLWVRTRDPLAFWWGVGAGHRLQLLGLHGVVDSACGFEARRGGDRDQGVRRPRVGLAGGGGGFSGLDDGGLEMEMWTRVWTGSYGVAASMVTARVAGRGARDKVGAGSWFGFQLGIGLGRGHLWCCTRHAFCDFCGCVGLCWWCW